MTLATTFGFLLLLANPQPQGIPATTFLFQAQENPPAQNPAEQTAAPSEAKPTQQPPSNAAENSGSTPQEPATQPASENTKPVPPRKATAKASAARKPVKKRLHSKGNKVVVVRNGGTSDAQGQISSGTSKQQAPQQLKNTNSLLSTTTTNLQKISGKQLNPSQQDMVKQIRNYMQQSKTAADAGDVQGANNLAVKARLLSEELVKH